MLIRAPDQYVDNTWLIVTKPFAWSTWVMVVVSVIVSGAVLKGFAMMLRSAAEIQYTLLGAIWVFFSVFVQQGQFQFQSQSLISFSFSLSHRKATVPIGYLNIIDFQSNSFPLFSFTGPHNNNGIILIRFLNVFKPIKTRPGKCR